MMPVEFVLDEAEKLGTEPVHRPDAGRNSPSRFPSRPYESSHHQLFEVTFEEWREDFWGIVAAREPSTCTGEQIVSCPWRVKICDREQLSNGPLAIECSVRLLSPICSACSFGLAEAKTEFFFRLGPCKQGLSQSSANSELSLAEKNLPYLIRGKEQGSVRDVIPSLTGRQPQGTN